ncbi:MAG: prepilin-type N-terminal cleavage/methylation domain-containing protein [Kiritimatiellia bacterium]
MKVHLKLWRRIRGCRGFTLTELMFAATISVVVLTAGSGAYIYILRSWHGIQQRIDADTDLNMAISRMVYGMNQQRGIRSAQGVSLDSSGDGWTLWYKVGAPLSPSNSITFSPSAQTLVLDPGNLTLGRGIAGAEITVDPAAYPRWLKVKLEADRSKAGFHVKRDIATTIVWRN